MSTETYRIVRSPLFKPSQLAMSNRYSRLEDAVADMGEGVVIGEGGRLVAFHERHLNLARRLADLRTA